MPDGESIRIDQLLYFLRLAKSRSIAQLWARSGHVRADGTRVQKSSATVVAGSIITFPKGEEIISFRLIAVPHRRGPAQEAQRHYQLL